MKHLEVWLPTLLTGCARELAGGAAHDSDGYRATDLQVTIGALPTQPVSEDLVVTGTASHPLGLAIVQVEVQGRSATALHPGFASWSVTLPYADLVAWSEPSDGSASICARARGVEPGWSDERCGDLVVAAP